MAIKQYKYLNGSIFLERLHSGINLSYLGEGLEFRLSKRYIYFNEKEALKDFKVYLNKLIGGKNGKNEGI